MQPEPDTTVGREVSALARLASPIAIAQLGLVAIGLVDTAVLGRVSPTELAGAAIGRSIGFAALTLAIGVSTALEPIAAQAVGAGGGARAWEALKTTVSSVLALWVPSMIVGYGVTLLLVPVGVSPAVAARAHDYFVTQAPGLALTLVFLAGKTFLQAHGSTRPALVAALVANVVNLAVCSVLVRGDDALADVGLGPLGLPHLGAFGAGIASCVAQVVLVAVLYPAVWSYRPKRDAAGPASSPRVLPGEILAVGVPVGIHIFIELSVFTAAAMLIGRFGPESVAAHQIAIGLASFTYLGALGVSGATAVRVGHAVGAGTSIRRRGTVGILFGVAFMALPALAFALVPKPILMIFTGDPTVIALAVPLLRIAAFFQLFDGVQTVAAGALRGAGDVHFAFLANIVAQWGIGFPLAYALAFPLGYGMQGIWWGLTTGIVAIAIALAGRFVVLSRGIIAPLEARAA